MRQDEGQLVHGAPMADVVSGQLSQTQLGHQLLHEDDESNGGDKTTQEWFREHAIEEAQAKQA